MIAIGRPEPDPPVLTEVVWRMYLKADAKTAPQILTGCAAWLSAPAPVQATAGAS